MRDTTDRKTPYPVAALVPTFLFLIYVVPVVAAFAPLFVTSSLGVKLTLLTAAPITFLLTFAAVCAILSAPFQRAIVPGAFPRQVSHYVYGPRRLYGLCWGAVFYFTPAYYVVVSIPFLRKALFRAFGYRGHDDVSIAPDAWIRDLPLLSLGEGTYIANKATMGTNMCLSDGTIIVERIRTGKGTMVGHLVMVAPGCVLGDHVEVGPGSGVGVRARLGNGTRIGSYCLINHGARLGESVHVGAMSYVGRRAVIGDGVKLPSGSNIPDGAKILTQEDAAQYLSSETNIRSLKEGLATLVSARSDVSADLRMMSA